MGTALNLDGSAGELGESGGHGPGAADVGPSRQTDKEFAACVLRKTNFMTTFIYVPFLFLNDQPLESFSKIFLLTLSCVTFIVSRQALTGEEDVSTVDGGLFVRNLHYRQSQLLLQDGLHNLRL